jgi:hypothetical protein
MHICILKFIYHIEQAHYERASYIYMCMSIFSVKVEGMKMTGK